MFEQLVLCFIIRYYGLLKLSPYTQVREAVFQTRLSAIQWYFGNIEVFFPEKTLIMGFSLGVETAVIRG